MSARDFVPDRLSLANLRKAADVCKGCELHERATQTVFGEGKASARLILVGEQPGDQEDRQGHPFVGPAGKLLDEVLAEAGIDRSLIYVTNTVKHFYFGDFRITQQRGKLLDTEWAKWIMATYHPSALLRAPDKTARRQMRDGMVQDLRLAAQQFSST